jgi:hypothetical protein
MEAPNNEFKDANHCEMELDQKPQDQAPPPSPQDSKTLQKDRSFQKRLLLRKLTHLKNVRKSRIPISSSRLKRKALFKRKKTHGNGNMDALSKTLTELGI